MNSFLDIKGQLSLTDKETDDPDNDFHKTPQDEDLQELHEAIQQLHECRNHLQELGIILEGKTSQAE